MRIRVNLAGKKQGEHKPCLIKASFRQKFGGESGYHLDLENEDKRRYKEKSTLSNGELLPDPNISISLLFHLSVNLIL